MSRDAMDNGRDIMGNRQSARPREAEPSFEDWQSEAQHVIQDNFFTIDWENNKSMQALRDHFAKHLQRAWRRGHNA